MLHLHILPFNPFQVNTCVLYDETGQCAIIDAACYGGHEQRQLQLFIEENKLKPVLLLNTHCHIDHILGNNFVYEQYGLKPVIHAGGLPFLESAVEYGATFGFDIDTPVMPDSFLEDEQIISFGNQNLKVLYTPGHADGSVCFYHEPLQLLIVGDVLFHRGIGRTDLPTGNYATLIQSINDKLMSLPDDVRVICGHGPDTTIGQERIENPYF